MRRIPWRWDDLITDDIHLTAMVRRQEMHGCRLRHPNRARRWPLRLPFALRGARRIGG